MAALHKLGLQIVCSQTRNPQSPPPVSGILAPPSRLASRLDRLNRILIPRTNSLQSADRSPPESPPAQIPQSQVESTASEKSVGTTMLNQIPFDRDSRNQSARSGSHTVAWISPDLSSWGSPAIKDFPSPGLSNSARLGCGRFQRRVTHSGFNPSCSTISTKLEIIYSISAHSVVVHWGRSKSAHDIRRAWIMRALSIVTAIMKWVFLDEILGCWLPRANHFDPA